jgi:DNA-binding phage protein
MMRASRPFHPTQIALLTDPEKAALYVEETLAAGDMAALKLAVRNVAEARLGGIAALTRVAMVGRSSRKTARRRLPNGRRS